VLEWYKKQSILVKILLAVPFLVLLVVAGIFAAGGLTIFKPRSRANGSEVSRDKAVVAEDLERVRQDTTSVKRVAEEVRDENKRAANSNIELGSLADAIRKGLDEGSN
jgi:type II secretory pathway component PulM